VVVDEAHHSVAPTYKVILQGLGLIEEVPAPPPADPQQPDSSDSSAAALSSLDSFSEGQQRSSMDSLDEGEEQLDTASAASASSSWGEEGSKSSEASAADEEGSSSTAASGPKMMIRVKPNPHQLLLGFTATPYRMKKAESEDLYSIFPSYSYARTIQDMIRDNHLTQVRQGRGGLHMACVAFFWRRGTWCVAGDAPRTSYSPTVPLATSFVRMPSRCLWPTQLSSKLFHSPTACTR
jgi:hypothetical protein